MRHLVYTRDFGGLDFNIDVKGKKFNCIRLEVLAKSSYSLVESFRHGSIVVETEGFTGDLWKLYLLNVIKAYSDGDVTKYDEFYKTMIDGYGDIRYATGDKLWSCLPIFCKCADSETFNLRVSNMHGVGYSVPNNLPYKYRLQLYYDDSVSGFPAFTYVGDIQQGESKEWNFEKKTNAYLTIAHLFNSGLCFSSDMAFTNDDGVLLLSDMLPRRLHVGNSVDTNLLCGYPIRLTGKMYVGNAYITNEQSEYLPFGDATKTFDLWIEK